MSQDDGEPEGLPLDPTQEELERLLQFVYQCPVGLVEMADDGTTRMINPAAARMLQSVLTPGDDLAEMFTVLRQLAPELVDLVLGDRARLGALRTPRRVVVPIGPGDRTWVELLAVRVDTDRVMLVVLDVSRERESTAREHELAVSLQKAMLGRTDPQDGVRFSVAYRTAEVELLVGGDWYDVISLPDGRVGVAVGDVVGHSVDATVAMGQLRQGLRYTAPAVAGPGELLGAMDPLASPVDGAACTTVFYAVLDPADGALEYANAGHLPPLVVSADGSTRFLDERGGVPLACGVDWRYQVASDHLRPGDRVVLYTDGLVERRGESLSTGLARLRREVPEVLDAAGANSEQVLRHVLRDHVAEDDVCVMVITYVEPVEPVEHRAPGPVLHTTFTSPRPRAGGPSVIDVTGRSVSDAEVISLLSA